MKKKLFVSLLSTLIILYLIPSRDVFASIINESYSSDGIKTYYVSTEQEKTTVLNLIKANMETVVNIVYSGDTVPKSKEDLYYYYLYDAYNNSNIYQDDVSLFLNKISLCDGFPVETATFNDKNNTVLVTYDFTYFDTEEQSESNNTILNEAIIENISSLKSDYDKALWAYQWVINKLHYDVTLRNFSINSGLIGDGTICVGYAALYNVLANKLGLACRLVEGSVYNNDGNNHDWNIIKLDDKWYVVDTTFGDGADPNKYFLKSIYTMNTEEYGNHISDLYYSYIKSGEIFADSDFVVTENNCEITPISPSVYGVKTDVLKTNIIKVGEVYKFVINNPDNVDLSFKSSNPDIIAYTNSGTIIGRISGTTTFTVYNEELNISQSCTITVK